MFEQFTDQARHLVVDAQRRARELEHGWIGTEHVLLALLADPHAPGAATLTRLGLTFDSCRDAVVSLAEPGAQLDEEDGAALRAVGIDLDEVRRRAEETFGEGALDGPGTVDDGGHRFSRRNRDRKPRGHIPFTKPAKKALESSLREALARDERRIGAEHITLGLLSSADERSARLFRRLNIEPQAVREHVLTDLSHAA